MVNKQEVQKLMEKLGISEQEALDLITFDNEEIDNEKVVEIENKIKENQKKKKKSSLEKVKNMKKKKTADVDKETIMAALNELILANPNLFKNVQNPTPTKITFCLNDIYYTISLTKHKKMPDGYKVGE